MAEQTYTATEVAEILTMCSAAVDAGADMIVNIMEKVPSVAETQTSAQWIRQFAEQNVKQLNELAEMVREG